MENKTKKLFAGLASAALATSVLAACDGDQPTDKYYSSDPTTNPPIVQGCTNWNWDGYQWQCTDGSLLHHYGGGVVFFYAGGIHTTSFTHTNVYTSYARTNHISVTRGTNVSSRSVNLSKSSSLGKSSSVKSGGFGGGTRGGFSTGG